MLILRVSEWGIEVHRVGQNWCSRICVHRVSVHIMLVSILLGCVHCILCKWAHVQVYNADRSQWIVQIPNTVTVHCIASRRIKGQLTIELPLILIPYDLVVAGRCKTCWAKSLHFELFCRNHLYDGMITTAFGIQSVSKERRQSWKSKRAQLYLNHLKNKLYICMEVLIPMHMHWVYCTLCSILSGCHYAVHTIATFLERTNKTVLHL